VASKGECEEIKVRVAIEAVDAGAAEGAVEVKIKIKIKIKIVGAGETDVAGEEGSERGWIQIRIS